MRIFAYGSNMNSNRLKARAPSAVKVCNACLQDHRMVCNKVSGTKHQSGKGNIVPDNESVVWGVIFEIADEEKPLLDKAEGLGEGYNEAFINVSDENGEMHNVQVYIADTSSVNDTLRPYDWYKAFIVSGAKENILPAEYITALENIADQVDANEPRRNRNFGIL